jgi:hypothetical protein
VVLAKGGVRALAAIGMPLKKTFEACAESPSCNWRAGYEAGLYYEDAASFLDAHIKKTANRMYGFFVSMALSLPKAYARYKPPLSRRSSLSCGGTRVNKYSMR